MTRVAPHRVPPASPSSKDTHSPRCPGAGQGAQGHTRDAPLTPKPPPMCQKSQHTQPTTRLYDPVCFFNFSPRLGSPASCPLLVTAASVSTEGWESQPVALAAMGSPSSAEVRGRIADRRQKRESPQGPATGEWGRRKRRVRVHTSHLPQP